MKLLSCFLLLTGLTIFFSDSIADEKVLCISDIHFDPFYDTTLVERLINADHSSWADIFDSSKDKSLGRYGEDANYFLLKSALSDLSKKRNKMDLIYISGDFLSHEFIENFYKYSGSDSQTLLRDFIEKTIRFLKNEFDEYLPDIPVILALGNNDSYCGDYMLEPMGDFTQMFFETWNDRIPGNADYSEKASMGYFDLYYPEGSKNRFVVLSTVYNSPKYENQCGTTNINPAEEQFKWLQQILIESKQNGDVVNLLYHIAPGADVYSTIKKDEDCKGKIVLQWKDEDAIRFYNLVYEYKDVINTQIAGHIHRDDFRVFVKSGEPFGFIHLNPAISPIYYNNPSYQILTVDMKTFDIKNAQTYYLNLPDNEGVWINEYDFNIAYNQNGVNKNSLYNVAGKIQTDGDVKQRYFQYYTSFLTSGLEQLESEWQAYWCAITNMKLNEFEECYCE